MPVLAVLGLAGLAGACAPYPLRGADPTIASQTNEVPITRALILPPPGGPKVLAVTEIQFQNAVEQEVVLSTRSATPGQNALHIVMFGPAAGNVGAERTRKDERLSEEALAEEMEKRLPDVPMHVSTFFVQNRYGPFGYAIGRTGTDLCIYGWQRIEAQVPRSPIIKGRGVVAVRLRLCQTGATEAKLLSVMYGYTINAYFLPPAWDPYGRPLPVPPETGRVGGPITLPEGPLGMGTVLDGGLGPEPRAPAPARRRAPAAEAAPTGPQPPSTPLEGYPTVPAPGAN
ncbi:cellulose biosynthesis protein BcsN [Ancylobacter terrae]|uniref:cellulose biosynthesis protein BcsN n=1 Tax=Ancylobacter sp. sgz301288 TaxID=3342077 RepID=UPI00385D0AFC